MAITVPITLTDGTTAYASDLMTDFQGIGNISQSNMDMTSAFDWTGRHTWVNTATTQTIISVTGSLLSTGKLAYLYSNSPDTSSRYLVSIVNDNTSATGAIPFHVQQGANQYSGLIVQSSAETDFTAVSSSIVTKKTAFTLYNPNTTTNNFQSIDFITDSSNISMLSTARFGVTWGARGAGATSPASFFWVTLNGTGGLAERMRLTSEGNLGIGNNGAVSTGTGASQLLTVGSTAASAATVECSILGYRTTDTAIASLAFVNMAVGGAEKRLALIVCERVGSDDRGLMYFYTKPTGGAITQALGLSSTQEVGIVSGKKLYLDGVACSGDTAIYESSANNISILAGGANVVTINSTAFNFTVPIYVESGDKVHLDGGGDTYIYESSSNVLDTYVGGTRYLSLGSSQASIGGSSNIIMNFSGLPYLKLNSSTGSQIYLNDTGTYIIDTDVTGSKMSIWLSSTETLRFNASGTLFKVLPTTGSAANAFVDSSTGLLSRSTSSAKYKENITDIEFDTSKVLELRPVGYDDKKTKKRYFGLIAEEVAKIMPEGFIDWGKDNDPEYVFYDRLIVPLIAEVKKLRKEVNVLNGAC